VASQKREGAGQLTIRTARADGGVEITFSDDGPGIADDLKDRIFDPFFTTKPLGQGTGQGLFVAYAIIVEQHGGRVRCESEPGRGATFRIWLPLARARAA
jgi:signal transduction histidine kinase